MGIESRREWAHVPREPMSGLCNPRTMGRGKDVQVWGRERDAREVEANVTERVLAEMFEDFNARYFDGRLPRYRVVFRWGIPGSDVGAEGFHDRKRRMIILCRGMRNSPREVAFMLLHEMVHAAKGGYHGARFWREWFSLRDAGAPIGLRGKVHYQHMPTRELPRTLRMVGAKTDAAKGARRDRR